VVTRDGFERLWTRLGATTTAAPVYRALTTAYSEPARAYHDLRHLADCLAQLRRASHLAERPEQVEMALWYHDAVYDPRASDNELRSAEWAQRDLSKAGVPEEVTRRVSRLILATRHDTPPDRPDAELLADIDLSILGRSEAEFDDYDRNIRIEYQWVADDMYRTTRARILEAFLERARIFRTPLFHALYEEPARHNLRRAIGRLRGSSE